MSAISLKSITGITSITTPAGVDNVFTVHSNDTTERFRVDSTGNLNIAGIITATNLSVSGNASIGGVLTYEDVTNIDSVGIITARDDIKVGSGVTITPAGAGFYAGIVTASSFKLPDGSSVGGVESDAQRNTVGGTNAGDSFSGTNATDNTIFGYNAGTSLTSGDKNVIIGSYAGLSATTIGNFVAIGNSAYSSCVTNNGGSVAIGRNALQTYTGGFSNVAIGQGAGQSMGSSGGQNTLVGDNAGYGCKGFNSVIIGFHAGSASNTQGGETIIGMQARYFGNNKAGNTAVGKEAMKGVSGGNGSHTTAIGYEALKVLNNGGNQNTALGYQAGDKVNTGASNVIIGYSAASTGTNDLTNGSNNIIIGKEAAATSATVSNEITLGDANIDKLRVPGLTLEFAKDHTYGVSGGRKNWFDNGSFDCRGGRRGNTSMDYGNYHAYGWVTDRWMSRDGTQWTRSTNVPVGKGFSYSTSANGGGVFMQAVELPDYGDMGVFAPSSYWCISYWGTVGANLGAAGFHYDLSGGYTGISQVASGSFLSSGETASGSSSGTFTRYYKNVQMPSSINSTAIAAYFTIGLLGSGYATGFQLERIPYSTAKPSPYEHVDPATTIARCRRYCFQTVNSRLFGGYKRHDNNIHWSDQHPVPPTHMPSGSNQANPPYGITLHDAGLLTNFQSILQNPAVNTVYLSEFDYRSGRFIIVGTTNWSSTHTFVPSWESQEYEIHHGFF